MPFDIPYVAKGDQPSAAKMNKLIDEVRRLGRWRAGDGIGLRIGPYGQEIWAKNGKEMKLGTIVAAGSCSGVEAGGTSFNDRRYWVVRSYVEDTEADACDEKVRVAKYLTDSALYEVVLVTNLTESNADSHGLRVGTPVLYWDEYDLGNPPRLRHYMEHAEDVGIPQYQFMVLQGTAMNRRGWGWVSAHPAS